ncbi:MAG TPA: cyclase family protein [Ktedonobacteraceae bacterium]|jgi:kynurenine formamidase|nr:cyclase family protein [Ktedonobacteraceae bacterium]
MDNTTVLAQLIEQLQSGQLKIVDLTTPLGSDTPVIDLPPIFAPSPGLTLTEISRYDERGPAWYWNVLNLGEHTGTHFDAPIHWVTGKDLPNNATDTIPPSRFIGPACVIDVSADVEQNPDFLLTIERVEQWESQYGRLPSGAWLLIRTGWSKHKGREEFLGLHPDGTSHSPGFHPSCSAFLAKERDILGVGVETVGTDAGLAGGFDPPFPSHTFMHGAGKFGITSLINLDQLPPTGAIVIAAPLKIVNGSGSPLRVLAITP